jgi:quercetin dioxygenase-like cupin family protein
MTPDLDSRLRAEGLDPGSWSNGPGHRYGPHVHDYDKVLVVASGSIRFGLVEGGDVVAMEVGDRLDLAAGTRHDAVVGPHGVVCLEAHAPAGRLSGTRLVRAGDW